MSLCSICKIDTSGASALACGVCYVTTHASCLGFKGPDSDKVSKHSGIKFYCSIHENLSPKTIISKFRQLKRKFDVLNKNLNEMLEILSDERLFLEGPLGPESNTQTENFPAMEVDEHRGSSDIASPTPAQTRSMSNSVPLKRKNGNSDKLVEPKRIKPTKTKSNTNNSNVNVPIINLINEPQPSTSSGSQSEIVSENSSEEELEALPPPKVVFISNLANGSTIEKIQDFISKRIDNIDPSKIFVHKMNLPDNREYSSFKITVRDNDLYDTLLNKQFWPRNTFVKPFLRRTYQAVIPE